MPDDYRLMINTADKNANRDDLAKILSEEHSVVCTSSPMEDISRASFDQSDRFAVLDSSGPGVYLFAKDGSYVGQLGAKGRGPGQYRLPWSVVSTGAGFAVADFSDHRVNIYDQDRRFSSSFIYSVQRFSATGIRYDQQAHKFYLFGDRLQVSAGREAIDFVHIYKDDGTFLGSIYQLPPTWLGTTYLAVDTPLLATDTTQNQYFMFTFDPVLHRINQPDSSMSDLPLILPGFKAPAAPLPKDQRGMNSVLSWDLTFTPIRSLALYQGYTVVEYESHLGLRYTIALFKSGSNKPVRTIETNHLLLGINSDGMAVFTNNPGSKKQDIHELTYGRFLI